MSDMVEVVIDSVRVSLMSPQRVVVLRQTDVERYLAIWVGPYEAESITVALQEVEMSRPLTHDLLKNIFGLFDAKILRIEIITLKDDIFYGNIVAEADGREINVDSRPSDAIALALRFGCPVYTYENIMVAAGILMEEDPDMAKSEESAGDEPLPEETSFSDYSMEELARLLQSSVENEEYEKASRIRDEIKKRK